jgi:hypothetical protein
MVRPRCDGFDAGSIRAAIEQGKATERAAYLAYAATAARPYARSTFALMLRNAANGPAVQRPQDEPDSDVFWAARLKVKPSIVTTCADNATLRVKGGALIVYDGAHSLTYEAGASIRPPSSWPDAVGMTALCAPIAKPAGARGRKRVARSVAL